MLVLNKQTFLPVTRYAEGMSRGAYYTDEATQSYCGTFYYLEEDSEVLLSVDSTKLIYFKNKLAAAKWLTQQADLPLLERLIQTMIRGYASLVKENNLIKDKLTREQLLTEIERSFTEDDYWSSSFTFNQYYEGESNKQYVDNFYATEDAFDQPICIALQKLGYDVVLLGMMAGKTRMVAEVLDTRAREESLAALVYIVN